MIKYNVFIDGEYTPLGTLIKKVLENHPRIRLLHISPGQYNNEKERLECMRYSDVTVCCLPDEMAKKLLNMILLSRSRLIDMSGVYRCNRNFVYGIPELSQTRKNAIKYAQLVSNPGSYATGLVSILRPLIKGKALPSKTKVGFLLMAGYSENGTTPIKGEDTKKGKSIGIHLSDSASRQLSEIELYGGLRHTPGLVPIIGDFERGICTCVQFKLPFGCTSQRIHDRLSKNYLDSNFIKVLPLGTYIEGETQAELSNFDSVIGTNNMEISVFGGKGKNCVVTAKYDNLGKGSVLACVQNLNVMLELDETQGIILNDPALCF